MKATVLVGDVLARLTELPDESVQCVVTSPPYWGLRDYGVAGQLGLERTPEEYVAKMVAVFREVRRVLRRDGTLWLNMGGCYAASQYGGGGTGNEYAKKLAIKGVENYKAFATRKLDHGLKPKDLVGIPWRVAFALQADGWWLRSDIIWSKPNPMPESVTDRPTKAHEYVFLLTKSARYFYDADAVRETATEGTDLGLLRGLNAGGPGADKIAWHAESIRKRQDAGIDSKTANPGGRRNLRSVWAIATQPFPEAHFATFPEELAERCIKAGTSERGACGECGAPWTREVERELRNTEGWGRATKDHHAGLQGSDAIARNGQGRAGDSVTQTLGWAPSCAHSGAPVPCVVLDPFAGSGTTGVVALKLGRSFIGTELNADYAAMAERRLSNVAPLLAETKVHAPTEPDPQGAMFG